MKKYTNILFALGVTLFLLTVGMKNEVKAQPCTYPYQHQIEIVTVGGCSYEVDLCIWCAYTYPGDVKINSIKNLGPCGSLLTPDQIIQQVLTQLMDPYNLWFNLCNSNLPPCKDSPPFVVKLETPICWKLILFYKDKLDSTNNRYISVPCDYDVYCKVEHSYCVDKYGVKHHSTGPAIWINFPPKCILEGSEITIPTKDENDESECFILHTPCNP